MQQLHIPQIENMVYWRKLDGKSYIFDISDLVDLICHKTQNAERKWQLISRLHNAKVALHVQVHRQSQLKRYEIQIGTKVDSNNATVDVELG